MSFLRCRDGGVDSNFPQPGPCPCFEEALGDYAHTEWQMVDVALGEQCVPDGMICFQMTVCGFEGLKYALALGTVGLVGEASDAVMY